MDAAVQNHVNGTWSFGYDTVLAIGRQAPALLYKHKTFVVRAATVCATPRPASSICAALALQRLLPRSAFPDAIRATVDSGAFLWPVAPTPSPLPHPSTTVPTSTEFPPATTLSLVPPSLQYTPLEEVPTHRPSTEASGSLCLHPALPPPSCSLFGFRRGGGVVGRAGQPIPSRQHPWPLPTPLFSFLLSFTSRGTTDSPRVDTVAGDHCHHHASLRHPVLSAEEGEGSSAALASTTATALARLLTPPRFPPLLSLLVPRHALPMFPPRHP